MGKIALKLNGKPLDLNPVIPASILKIRGFLEKAPADELFENRDFAAKMNVAVSTLGRAATAYAEHVNGFTHSVRLYGQPQRRFWGNPKAIAELRRQTA